METTEATFILGKSKWERQSAMPDMWSVVHQCENAGLNIHAIETITHLYIFLKQYDASTLEEFLQKFDEGAEKKNFYEFSKYCLSRYRHVHEQQLTGGMNPIEESFIRDRMKGAESMDQLGDEYHEDPKNVFWRTNASIIGPDDRELPRMYVKLMGSYDSFEDFMKAHKEFDKTNANKSVRVVDAGAKKIAHAARTALKR